MMHVTAPDGVRLAYDDRGSGPAILCLPGLTRNMEDFEPVVAAFADRARVLRMDFRGRGASDWAKDPSSYSVPQEAQDVLAVLDHLGLERVAILGTSRGGLVAMMLGALAKPRLAGVFFNDVGPAVEPAGLDYIMSYLGKPPVFKTFEDAAAALPGLNPSFHNVPDTTWAAFARRNFEARDGALHLRYDPRLREAVAQAFDTSKPLPDLWPLFDGLAGLPLALLRGAGSNILSAATAAEMRRRMPDMLFAELPDRGHVPFLDEPAAVDLIGRWIETLS